MKIPLSYLSNLVKLPEKVNTLSDSLTSIGHMLDKLENINGETILDLELRGNRADCYSIFGIAREVSAIFGAKVKHPETLKLTKTKALINSSLKVETRLVKRVGMIEILDVKITESPEWLRKFLNFYGIDSVNNIVDLTNYVMLEIGEPMHAFDLDKVTGGLEIRLANSGEKITTFQDITLTLTSEDLVWSKGSEVLSVAGAIGEKYHSISSQTKNILLEAANYERANIRRTVYRHNLLTEAGIRHEKELDPNMVEVALGRFLYFIRKYNWGTFKNSFYDYYPKKANPAVISLSYDYLNNLGGVNIEKKGVENILKRLNFKLLSKSSKEIKVEVPTYRTDVNREEDLVEEVLRIYGYDNIPPKILSFEIPDRVTPKFIIQEESVRNAAISCGFDEAISLSFVKNALNKYNLNADTFGETQISIQNPPSPDTKDLRQTLFPNLYDLSKKIINERGESVQLFEIGKVYSKIEGKYQERRKIAFIYWHKENSEFVRFKGLIEAFLSKINLDEVTFENEVKNIPLNYSYDLKIKSTTIGFGGEIDDLFFLEIDLDSVLNLAESYQISLWPKYPPQIEDITLSFPEKTRIGEVTNEIRKVSNKINSIELKDIFKGNYTFRIWYQDKDKTLTDKEVEEIRSKIIQSIKLKFGVIIKN